MATVHLLPLWFSALGRLLWRLTSLRVICGTVFLSFISFLLSRDSANPNGLFPTDGRPGRLLQWASPPRATKAWRAFCLLRVPLVTFSRSNGESKTRLEAGVRGLHRETGQSRPGSHLSCPQRPSGPWPHCLQRTMSARELPLISHVPQESSALARRREAARGVWWGKEGCEHGGKEVD